MEFNARGQGTLLDVYTVRGTYNSAVRTRYTYTVSYIGLSIFLDLSGITANKKLQAQKRRNVIIKSSTRRHTAAAEYLWSAVENDR